MNKITTVGLVCLCVLVVGALSYLFYRLYVNHVYKGTRPWREISHTRLDVVHRTSVCSDPRTSISPLVQDFLPDTAKKQSKQRKMITALRFDDAPEFIRQLDTEWEDMDRRSSTCARLLSTRTSYYTVDEHRSCEEDSRSSAGSSLRRTRFHTFLDPLIDLSRRLLGTDVDHSASLAVDADHRKTINPSKNVSQV